jgi:hypothetical protein
MTNQVRRIGIVIWPAIVVSLSLFFFNQASAQISTATIRGTVSDEKGPLPGAQVAAVDKQTGFNYSAYADEAGRFNLPGLKAGTYEITISLEGYAPQSHTASVLVGRTVTVDFQLASDRLVVEDVTVVGETLIETKNTDVSTNITSTQIETLPQNERNFLNFAGLAPGIRVRNDETRKQITSGGLEANSTNVFIDGVSYKNDTLEGGVIGQDSSRGNPFPQNAVQEFRVVTQNFKAEYETSASSIVTAVTKSGGNLWRGDAFLFYQADALVQQDDLSEERGDEKPELTRYQAGISLGGPIVKDKFHMFASFEENYQDRASTVFLGATPPAPWQFLDQFEGTFTSPFRSHLFFAKASYQPNAQQTLDFSFNSRNESDERGFGNQTSFESAEDVAVNNWTFLGKHQLVSTYWFNEASLIVQRAEWNPRPLNEGEVGSEYVGFMRIGGRDTEQDFRQDTVALRDDFSVTREWAGQHNFKTGAIIAFKSYDVNKSLNGNPLFKFRSDISFDFPAEALYGVGDPSLNADNRQFGVYFQDDWNPTPRVSINAGIRWDYETDQLNNDYVTPANVVAALTGLVPSQYFTDGDDRPAFTKAFQPRFGISYDISGDAKTVVFGGVGRYFDRVVYNHTLDERFRLQYGVRTFRFSADGLPRDGNPTIIWNDSYLSIDGLNSLIAQGIAPNPEVFLIDNNTEPPHTNQFNAGIRHAFGDVLVSATYGAIRGYNILTFIFGNRRPDGTCCQPVPGNFSNILLSSDAKRTWYDALYLTLEKPFTRDSNWAATVTYTLSSAEKIGGDLFSLDKVTVTDYPRHPIPDTDERHRIVISGIYRLPHDFTLSGLFTYGSGLAFTITDASRGFGPNELNLRFGEGTGDPYQSFDVRVQKDFTIGGSHKVGGSVEVFNILGHDNFADFNGFIPPLPEVNPNFGKPNRQFDTRRLQFGVNYIF